MPPEPNPQQPNPQGRPVVDGVDVGISPDSEIVDMFYSLVAEALRPVNLKIPPSPNPLCRLAIANDLAAVLALHLSGILNARVDEVLQNLRAIMAQQNN
jgi:hypothetical protein